jgi:hypothetical protein
MDLISYCIYLSKSANDLIIQMKFAIKNLPAAGNISTNNAGKYPAFPL